MLPTVRWESGVGLLALPFPPSSTEGPSCSGAPPPDLIVFEVCFPATPAKVSPQWLCLLLEHIPHGFWNHTRPPLGYDSPPLTPTVL